MKSWRSPSVKSALAGLGLAILMAGGAAAAPLTHAEARIDLHGVSAIAAHLKRALPRYLNRELTRQQADAPQGSRLIVRVTEIFLSSDLGAEPDGGVMMDALEGEAILLDARGAVISRTPVKARTMPEFGPMGTSREPHRVEALAESLAYWVARQFR